RSSCTPPGRPFRGRTTTTGRTCRRSTRRSCSASRTIAGSGRSRAGGRRGCCSRRPSSSCGGRAVSASPATTTAARRTRRSAPPACSVGEPRKGYWGENSLPLILQNVHRYFLYVALVFLFFLAWDVWKALWFKNPDTGVTSFGVGVGTLVLAVNVVLLGGYSL